MNKIAIFGWPATGKSTLGEVLSNKLDIELYSLDLIRWKYSENGVKNDDKFLKDYNVIIKQDKWIIEGNALDFIDSRLEQADLLIFFDSTADKCIKNYIERENKIILNVEKRKKFDCNKTTGNMINWIKDRYAKKIELLRPKLIKYNNKLVIINNYDELNFFIESFSDKTL